MTANMITWIDRARNDRQLMKSKLHKLSTGLTGLIVLCGIGGCAMLPTPTMINPTDTKFETATLTSPTLPLSATQTPIPTSTTHPLTPTAIQTLDPENAGAEILRLLSADHACLFPC